MQRSSWSSLFWFTTAMALVLVYLFNAGCAPKQIHSHWADAEITADGSENDWLHPPQHHDIETSERVWVTNDQETLNICFSVKSDKLERQLLLAGLTLWIDPLGERSKTFGIHLPGARPDFRRNTAPAAAGVRNGPPDAHGRSGRPNIDTPKTLYITYSDATGPLKMDLSD